MATFLECVPCLVRQALDSLRATQTPERFHEAILRSVLMDIASMDFAQPPAALAHRIHQRIRDATGQSDPYAEQKRRLNDLALTLYPSYRQQLQRADNPLELGVRLAIAGNVMDLGVKSGLDETEMLAALESCVTARLAGNITDFARAVAGANRILYLTDNAGEILFDRLLVEQLPHKRVTVAVRGRPIINDATREDAEYVGLTQLVEIIDNGSGAPGTLLEDCSPAFRQCFAAADLIISKGQGNYETLAACPRPIYFLLRVKCPVVARDLRCPVGTMVLRNRHEEKP